jgi:hypothetical protein
MSTEPSTYVSFRPDYSTRYAIIVACPDGGVANYIAWSCNDSEFACTDAEWSAYQSTNSGSTWSMLTSDFMFRITGNSTLRIIDISVFTNYIETGDMIFLIHYEAWLDSRYPDPKRTFYFLSENATDSIGKTSIPAWGYQPGSIYLAPEEADKIAWRGDCTITLAPFTETCDNTTYSLVPSDWVGDEMTALDKWVRETAALMDTYYSPDIDVYSETFGDTTLISGYGLLTEEGGEMFSAGVPSLEEVRPGLFYMIKHAINPDYKDFTHEGETDMNDTVGPYFKIFFNDWGKVFHMSGNTFAMLVMVGLSCGGAGIGMFVAQDVRGGIVGVVPIMLISFAMGFWPLAILSIIIMVIISFLLFTKVLTL